jgi:hypothetical protein
VGTAGYAAVWAIGKRVRSCWDAPEDLRDERFERSMVQTLPMERPT